VPYVSFRPYARKDGLAAARPSFAYTDQSPAIVTSASGVLLLSHAMTTPVRVLLESRMQHSIVGVSRATITSAASLLLSLPVQSLAFGLISRAWGLPAIYLASAILLFVLSAWMVGARKRLGIGRAHGRVDTRRHAPVP
jgi:hypothetical protein